ncbi:disabled homolog 1-like isoform X1 [Scomber scombrus]
METEQVDECCPPPEQADVGTWQSSVAKEATRTLSDVASRFTGDGIRYKAKLIGVDPVPYAHGDKMCWDSMMKLKGIEATGRKQGKHKQRVWLKISFSGLKIIDERTGAVLHYHERSRISSLTKDESDPRALAYIYQEDDTYSLFYIRMANLADPVLADLNEICQSVDQETPTQNDALLVLDESSAPPPEVSAHEYVFSPQPESSFGQIKQTSSSNELMEVFSIQLEGPMMPTQSECASPPVPPESQKPTLSTSQILSMYPTQPVGGSPYSSPAYSPLAAPWPTMPGNMAPWPAAGIVAPPAGSQIQAHNSQPGGMMRGNPINYLAPPSAANGYHTPLNPAYPPPATATLQSVSPPMEQNLFLL